jgi:hypothetical protein
MAVGHRSWYLNRKQQWRYLGEKEAKLATAPYWFATFVSTLDGALLGN